ncbi:response regulator [uncultured Algoriphagus sp.]|uniref:response regulator n=1 Tax=uncultured Algoriphagus sp. TaxID=417365 RepID=UPI0030ED7C85|tara:strand:+ start:10673 stop:11071 length:399 start_codon:yes stop_codon:yes gene_type:complete
MIRTRSITLIDDDEIFVFITKKTIRQTKLFDLIKVYDNGLDALNFLKENKDNADLLPEIILLDLNMPIMDGWQFLEHYTGINPSVNKEIVIYICSSSISPEDIRRAKAISEVTDYMIKPITKDKLIDLIKSL